MKKKYIEPASKLVNLNLNGSIMENVMAVISGETNVVGGKEDIESEDFGW